MKRIAGAVTLVAASLLPLAARAQADWPNRPVKIVVNGGPGSVGDISSRLLAEHFSRTFGQPFVVDNRPGANGMLGSEVVARAVPDGHTLLLSYTAAHVVNPHLYGKDAKYEPRDFAPIAQLGAVGTVLLVRSSLDMKALPDFISYAKGKGHGPVSYGSWGIGSGGHLSMEAVSQQHGLALTHVPYKTLATTVMDLGSGRLDAAFMPLATARPLLEKGTARPIAVTGPRRLPDLPDVKTLTEQGTPFDLEAWYALFAPAGTPPEVVNRLNAEARRVLALPALQERWQKLGLGNVPGKTPQEFAQVVQQDSQRWGEIVRKGGIKGE